MAARNEAIELLLTHDLDLLIVLCQCKVVGNTSIQFATLIIELLKQVDPNLLISFLTKALREKISSHLVQSKNVMEVLRDNSTITMVFSVYTRSEGKDYLVSVLGPIVSSIVLYSNQLEIDPEKLPQEDLPNVLKANVQRLSNACSLILDTIFKSIEKVPPTIRVVAQMLWEEMSDPALLKTENREIGSVKDIFLTDSNRTYSEHAFEFGPSKGTSDVSKISHAGSMQKGLSEIAKTPLHNALSETSKISPVQADIRGSVTRGTPDLPKIPSVQRIVGEESSDMKRTRSDMSKYLRDPNLLPEIILGALMFLRFYIPAITTPETQGLISQLALDRRRGLVLCGKVIAAICNQVNFGSKESCMMVMNGFINNYIPLLKSYLKDFSKKASDDVNRPKKVVSIVTLLDTPPSKRPSSMPILTIIEEEKPRDRKWFKKGKHKLNEKDLILVLDRDDSNVTLKLKTVNEMLQFLKDHSQLFETDFPKTVQTTKCIASPKDTIEKFNKLMKVVNSQQWVNEKHEQKSTWSRLLHALDIVRVRKEPEVGTLARRNSEHVIKRFE